MTKVSTSAATHGGDGSGDEEGKGMDAAVTVSHGGMGRLLQQLHSFEVTGNSRSDVASETEIQSFRADIDGLCTKLKNLTEVESPSFTAKCWMAEVRNLCYDTEDYLDKVTHSDAHVRESAPDYRIAVDFSELRDRAKDAGDRYTRCGLPAQTIKPKCQETSSREKRQVLPEPPSVLGVDDHHIMDDIVKLLGFNAQEQFKVVSILGAAGVGKTTLARSLYHKFGARFECRAFVRVSRNLDIRRFLITMLSQIKGPRIHVSSDAQDLVDNTKKHLQGKRYLIIIDDLWASTTWDIISRALQRDNCNSRIITTTQTEDVALACCSYNSTHIFKMRPRNDLQCGGLPCQSMMEANLLACNPTVVPQWEHLQNSPRSSLRTNPSSQGMKELLDLIYGILPHHLKACLLHFNMYPEDYTIKKGDLVKQWVAEGFVSEVNSGLERDTVAEGYFDELIQRGLIQQVDINYNNEVLSCAVHYIVLDFIRCKSKEENFITVVDYFQARPGNPDKVRRLSVQFGAAKAAKIPASVRMNQLRSLIYFEFFKCIPSVVQYGLLRVPTLHVWADDGNLSFDLSNIHELFRLRYLKIVCNVSVNFPAEIGLLRYLETLDLDARVVGFPSDIVYLQHLLHLRLPREINMLHGIDNMTSLRSLAYFQLSGDNVLDLGKLTNLLDLHLTCCRVQNDRVAVNMECLEFIMAKLRKLNSLILDAGSLTRSIPCDGLRSVASPPTYLQRLELSPKICVFSNLPVWIGELSKLCILKIALRDLPRNSIDILKRLSTLTVLSLSVQTTPAERVVFDEGFQALRYFRFTCPAPCLSIVKGAMVSVGRLKLNFNANSIEEYDLISVGFQYLTSLQEIRVKFGDSSSYLPSRRNAAESALEGVVSEHPNTPIVNVQWVERFFYGDKENITSGQERELQVPMTQSIITGKDSDEQRVEEKKERTAQKGKQSVIEGDDPVITGAAVSWGLSEVGSGVLSNIIDRLFKHFSYLGIDRSEKLKELQTKVLQLELVLQAVEECPDKRLDRSLVQQIKSAFYEAEDVFDDVEYYRLERQILSQRDDKSESDDMATREGNWFKNMLQSALPNKRPRLEEQTSGTKSGDAPPVMSKSKLENILEKIDRIINEAHKSLILLNLPSHTKVDETQTVADNSRRPVPTTMKPHNIIGRDEDRDKVLAMLHEQETDHKRKSNSSLSHSIIGIHGISGSGKSTLAQHVCAHEKKDKREKKEGHFDLIMWVHVSQSFDVDDIFSKILQEATRKSWPGFTNCNTLEQELEEALSEKRFLLVLDDVWYKRGENQQDLQKVVSLLKAGTAGSKILATSRTEKALLALGAVKERCIPISEMDDSVFLKLFMHYALDVERIDEQDQRTFEVVGAQIAKKLKGSPLAATTVGARLRDKNWDFWLKLNARQHLGDVMDFLKWSYQHFDKEVRRCFAYCCIFPRRYELNRAELIKLWVAQGFITVTNGEEKEDVAQRHFDHLVSALFLRPVSDDDSKGSVTIHDLLHDLAKEVAGNECYTIQKGWTGHVPQEVRHLLIEIDGQEMISKKVLELQNLRTLIIINTQDTEELLVEDVLESVFTNLHMLRAFILKVELSSSIGGREISIPESIGDLLYLRYFYLSKAFYGKITFPRRFARLYHMEVLDVGYSQWGKVAFSSGEDTTNLINLRVVPDGAEFDFPFIGRMESLQTLYKFTVKKETGYELFQLKKLNKVRHVLKIYGLENVLSKEDAQEAELHEKAYIRGLKLTWSPSGEISVQEQDIQSEVIQALRPPTHLQTLAIESYKGSSYPSWMTGDGPEVLMCLRDLMLIDCSELASIPEHSVLFKYLHALDVITCNWRYFPDNMERLNSLLKLGIQSCNEILSLPTLPQSLKKLKIEECDKLKSLATIPQSLQKLEIKYCNEIISIPTLPQFLDKLMIKVCGKLESLPIIPQSLQKLKIKYYNAILSLPTLPQSLKELIIKECKNLRSFPTLPKSLETLVISFCSIKLLPTLPQSLKKLIIEECKNLMSLPTLLQSLKELIIEECKNLRSLPTLPQSLEELIIKECKNLRSLPTLPKPLETLVISFCSIELLPTLPQSLKELIIEKCKNLRSLPTLPQSLKELIIKECKNLKSLPTLPKSLETLVISFCSIELLPTLPQSLKELIIEEYNNLRSLPTLPQSLKELIIKECKNLRSLPTLSQSLKELIIKKCKNLRFLPTLPKSLETLVISFCSIELLPTIPQSLHKLKIKYCNAILSLPTLPQSLKELIIKECKNLRSLPTLPKYVETLVISFCSIDLLPTLPQSLRKLMLHGFSKIDLSTMPPSLELFDVLTHDQEFVRSCETVGDENWEKIRHIPERNIQYEEFYREDDEDEGQEDDENDDLFKDEEEEDDVPSGDDQEDDENDDPFEDDEEEDDVPSGDDQEDDENDDSFEHDEEEDDENDDPFKNDEEEDDIPSEDGLRRRCTIGRRPRR